VFHRLTKGDGKTHVSQLSIEGKDGREREGLEGVVKFEEVLARVVPGKVDVLESMTGKQSGMSVYVGFQGGRQGYMGVSHCKGRGKRQIRRGKLKMVNNMLRRVKYTVETKRTDELGHYMPLESHWCCYYVVCGKGGKGKKCPSRKHSRWKAKRSRTKEALKRPRITNCHWRTNKAEKVKPDGAGACASVSRSLERRRVHLGE